MNDTPKTNAENHIEGIMRQVEPGSERYRVLDVARRFKSSWVELGEELLKVDKEGLYSQWGYESFEEYCQREIRIRKPTARKLTQAYRFLTKEEPQLLAERSPLKPLPDYRNIDLLRQAREERAFGDDDYAALRQTIIDEERSHPTAVKCFKNLAPPAEDDSRDPVKDYKKALAAARRLHLALGELDEPQGRHEEALAELTVWLETALADAEQARKPT
jgi:hypothetical protein